jgi:hypothetical protein
MDWRKSGQRKHGLEETWTGGRGLAGCERIGRSGSPDGDATSVRKRCRWAVHWTKEAKSNRPSEAEATICSGRPRTDPREKDGSFFRFGWSLSACRENGTFLSTLSRCSRVEMLLISGLT